MSGHRPITLLVALSACFAPIVAQTSPANAATCSAPTVLQVEARPSSVAIGIKKEGLVPIYADVQLDGCTVTSATAQLYSPTGGIGRWPMRKLGVSGNVVTFGVVAAIPPRELYTDDNGSWQLSASVTYGGKKVGNTGPYLEVLRAARSSVNATPEPVKKGKTITISGSLQRADWEKQRYVGYGKKSVRIQFKATGGSYATVRKVRTDAKGSVRTRVKAGRDGCFRLVYPGNLSTGATTSRADCVDVR